MVPLGSRSAHHLQTCKLLFFSHDIHRARGRIHPRAITAAQREVDRAPGELGALPQSGAIHRARHILTESSVALPSVTTATPEPVPRQRGRQYDPERASENSYNGSGS